MYGTGVTALLLFFSIDSSCCGGFNVLTLLGFRSTRDTHLGSPGTSFNTESILQCFSTRTTTTTTVNNNKQRSYRFRWIRSDGCRHALLLVRGAMFLVELPTAASDGTRGVTQDSRGWFLKITAGALSSLSVPLTPSQSKLGGSTFDWKKSTAGGGGGAVGGMGGLILRGRRGACAWVECGSADRRDALVDVVLAWHSAETKGSTLKVERSSVEEASAKVTRTSGTRYMASLLTDIVSCSWK